MTNRYYNGIRKETSICKVFQSYLEENRKCKSFLKTRYDKQAPIDYLGRLYDRGGTIAELAVEVRSLIYSKEEIEKELGYIKFPVSKLNELMKFWRMGKECYIVYLLKNKVWYINWDYYIKHNFELLEGTNTNYLKIPIQNFKLCG